MKVFWVGVGILWSSLKLLFWAFHFAGGGRYEMRPKPSLELQMKTARNRIGEVMEGWRVVAQPRQHRGVLLYEIQHLCGVKRTVYPQDWQRGFVACPKCK